MRENPLAFIVGRVLHRRTLPFKPVRVLSVVASFGKWDCTGSFDLIGERLAVYTWDTTLARFIARCFC